MSRILNNSPDGKSGICIAATTQKDSSKTVSVAAHRDSIYFGEKEYTLREFLFLLGITLEDVAKAFYGAEGKHEKT
jgi:hypothetical protein